MTESKAIELCLKDKDPAGFECLVVLYQKEAYYHAFGILRNQEDAADACQDSFRKAFRAFPQLRTLDRFYPWFYRILRNQCLNMLSRRKTVQDKQGLLEASEPIHRDLESPISSLEKSDDRRFVQEALDLLKLEFREILTLKYFNGYNYMEISQLIGVPRGTVMSRLYHARMAFKDEYEKLERRSTKELQR